MVAHEWDDCYDEDDDTDPGGYQLTDLIDDEINPRLVDQSGRAPAASRFRCTSRGRLEVDDLGHHDGSIHVTARFGYTDTPDVPAARETGPALTEGRLDLERASCFLSAIGLRHGKAHALAAWRNGCSSRQRTSPRTPPSTSACPATAQ
ncbi:hypothetical protein ACFXPA_46075 [Amycolatopsis sp. NPDC059090]|uniref:hypothetical protein n=1 Tax=Amycolatopsis sp. NPDC059090 TaxID=3346723 RepID=UPI00367112FB